MVRTLTKRKSEINFFFKRKETLKLPLEAFHGRHNGGGDPNHIEFHQRRTTLLPEEQV